MKTVLNFIYPNQKSYSIIEKIFAVVFGLFVSVFCSSILLLVGSLVYAIITGQADTNLL